MGRGPLSDSRTDSIPSAFKRDVPPIRVPFLYLMPIVAGGTLVLFMLKPLMAVAPHHALPKRLEPEDEPLLFAFIACLCRAVGAPRAHATHVDSQVNASASFWRGWLGMLSGCPGASPRRHAGFGADPAARDPRPPQ